MQFNYEKALTQLMVPEIMGTVGTIHEYRGRQRLYEATQSDTLEKLCEAAKIQSTGASNRIENIKTSDARLHALAQQKTKPKNRDEREIVGYRFVLDIIHSSYADIPITPNVILQLHRDLYRGVEASFAGHWKDGDNVIAEHLASGQTVVRFTPPSAVETPGAMQNLCEQYCAHMEAGRYDGLLVSLLFAFDFVSIHPFNDGNGRMSRLITLLLLYKCGYTVGRYVSVEEEIEKTKNDYYDALAASSHGWREGKGDYAPFVTYMLGVILACYQELDRRVSVIGNSNSYEDAVRNLISNHLGALSKREIMEGAGDMSRATADRILQKLQCEGFIEKIGAARATKYRLKQR